MITFLDGPAEGQELWVRRAPILLRVVYDSRTDHWDALDQLHDEPAEIENIWVYQLQGKAGWIQLCTRGPQRGKVSGRYMTGEYALVPDQPTQALLRDTQQWREWAEQQLTIT